MKRTDAYTLVWLTVGTFFLPFIGWIIALVRLWRSATWSQTEKVLGTLLWPVAFIGPGVIFLAARQDCSSNAPCRSDPAWPAVLLVAIGLAFVAIIARLWYTAARGGVAPPP